MSFVNLHIIYKRATPDQVLLYKHALNLYKLMKDSEFTTEWVSLNFNQILTSRQNKFLAGRANNKKVGLIAFANRVYILNNKIPLDWFNLTYDTFKIRCKKELL